MPLRVVPSYSRLPSKRCPSIGFLSRADREIGVFQQVAPPTKLRIEFPHETGLILSCAGKVGPPCRQSRGISSSSGVNRMLLSAKSYLRKTLMCLDPARPSPAGERALYLHTGLRTSLGFVLVVERSRHLRCCGGTSACHSPHSLFPYKEA